ncbi:hypothetical protein F4680DRAFT_330626 [Xylaria scruposa]|nr:hypothetical protein F4680DRAFT_330626 [Xylaria scruposa]
MSERCCNSQEFRVIFIVIRPFVRASFGLHLLFSLFRGISVRVLCFAPHGSATIIHWYSNAQIWSLIFEGKGVTTCALRPLIIDRNHATGNNYILAYGYRAKFVIQHRKASLPYQRQIQWSKNSSGTSHRLSARQDEKKM